MKHLVTRIVNQIDHLKSSHRRLTIGATANFLFMIKWKLVGLIITVLLGRLLGVEGLGTYTFAWTIMAFIATFSIDGLKWLTVQRMASYTSLKQWSLARGLQRYAQTLGLGSAIVLGLCAGLATWFFMDPSANELRLTMVIAAVLIPIEAQIYFTYASLQGLNHVILCQIPNWIVRPLIFLAFLLAFYFILKIDFPVSIDFSAPVAMAAQVLAAMVTLIVGIWLLRPRIPDAVKTATPTYATLQWVRAGIPFLAIGLLERVNLEANILLLGTLVGTEAVGLYRAAAAVGMMIMFGADAIALTVRPTLAQRYAKGRTESFQRLSNIAAWAGFSVAFIGCAIALLFGDLILLFLGPRFVEGVTALGILCVGRVILAASGQPTMFLDMTGRQSIILRGTLWAASANILLNLILIPHYGVNGAAIATASSLLVLNFYNMIAVRRELAVDTTIFGLRLRSGLTK